jgi:hypothetical protein
MKAQITPWMAAALLLASASAPVHSADAAGPISRDTGVGKVIAEQGNAALSALRDELKRKIDADLRQQLEQLLDAHAPLAVSAGDSTVAFNAPAVH